MTASARTPARVFTCHDSDDERAVDAAKPPKIGPQPLRVPAGTVGGSNFDTMRSLKFGASRRDLDNHTLPPFAERGRPSLDLGVSALHEEGEKGYLVRLEGADAIVRLRRVLEDAGLRVLRWLRDGSALVRMSPQQERELRLRAPLLEIEQDLQHRPL